MEQYIVTFAKLSGLIVGLVILVCVVVYAIGEINKLKNTDRD